MTTLPTGWSRTSSRHSRACRLVRHRAQFILRLQGPLGRHPAGRPRARRALRARGQRAQVRRPAAHHRPADRGGDRRAPLGGPVRRQADRHLRAAGRDDGAAIVGAIAPKLQSAEIERAKRVPTESLRSYDYYLRGLAYFHRDERQANVEALQLFCKAIELDPDFATAHGMAAWCYNQRLRNGWIADLAQRASRSAAAGLAGGGARTGGRGCAYHRGQFARAGPAGARFRHRVDRSGARAQSEFRHRLVEQRLGEKLPRRSGGRDRARRRAPSA